MNEIAVRTGVKARQMYIFKREENVKNVKKFAAEEMTQTEKQFRTDL